MLKIVGACGQTPAVESEASAYYRPACGIFAMTARFLP